MIAGAETVRPLPDMNESVGVVIFEALLVTFKNMPVDEGFRIIGRVRSDLLRSAHLSTGHAIRERLTFEQGPQHPHLDACS